jgi:hypothetical protein
MKITTARLKEIVKEEVEEFYADRNNPPKPQEFQDIDTGIAEAEAYLTRLNMGRVKNASRQLRGAIVNFRSYLEKIHTDLSRDRPGRRHGTDTPVDSRTTTAPSSTEMEAMSDSWKAIWDAVQREEAGREVDYKQVEKIVNYATGGANSTGRQSPYTTESLTKIIKEEIEAILTE